MTFIRPTQVPAAESPRHGDLMMLAVGVVTVAGLYLGRDVLVPIALAVLLSFVLAPLVSVLRKLWLGRVPAILIAVLLALGMILAIGGVIGSQLAVVVQDLPRYQYTIREKVETVRAATLDRIAAAVLRFGGTLQPPVAAPAPAPAPAAATSRAPGNQAGAREAPAPPAAAAPAAAAPAAEVRETGTSALDLLGRIVSPVVNPLVTLFLIVVVAIFILLQKEDLRDRMIRLFGSRDLHRTTAALDDAARRLSRYFLTQLALNAGFGLVIGLGLLALGVPNAALWGGLGALLRFVPYVGSLIAASLPTLMAAAIDPGWGLMLETAALVVATELVVGQALEPHIYGHSTGLSPVAVVVSAIFWTWLWGAVGLILATPLALCLVVLGRHVPRLEFLDVLLGDRPPLTPAESLYQRMLAGDPDEAVAYAEQQLKERSLSSYYDEVAVLGLRMASADAARGVLTPVQVERVTEAVGELVEQLADYDDVDPAAGRAGDSPSALTEAGRAPARARAPAGMAPPPEARAGAWASPAPVLLVAGRGLLDDCLALLLAQLLEKHGLGARVVPHAAVSRTGIAALDVAGVALACVVSLEIETAPAHLRYLLRRLRQRLPEATLAAGLWPEDDLILTDESVRRALSVDLTVTSLRAAVETCVAAAARQAQAPGQAA